MIPCLHLCGTASGSVVYDVSLGVVGNVNSRNGAGCVSHRRVQTRGMRNQAQPESVFCQDASGGLKCDQLPPQLNWGIDVFKIVETADRSCRPHAIVDGREDGRGLADFCITEEWTAHLDEGVMSIGTWTAAIHDLTPGRCGLTSLTRAYDPKDRRHILGLFEQASSSPSSFCFSSTIQLGQGRSQPVFCVARSSLSREGATLALGGVFVFPRFRLEDAMSGPPLAAMARFA